MRNPLYFSPVSVATFFFSIAFAGAIPTSAFAEELPNVFDSSIAQSVYSEGRTTIPGLTWEGDGAEPSFTIEGLKNGKPGARVSGVFDSKNAGTLLFSSEVIQRAQYKGDSSHFTVLIPLTGRKTPVKVKYIDDYGNLGTQDIEIVYENFYQFQTDQLSNKRKLNFDFGASVSYLDYKQTSAGGDQVKISQIGFTPKAGLTYNYSDKLDFGISTFITAAGLPISKTPDGLSTPRFYGVNLRVGYKVYSLKTGNIYLMTGPYFWGMIVPPSPNGLNYGVVKLSGPQLFVVGRFLTPTGRTAVGYIKAASILDGEGGMFSNREFALGAAYQLTPISAKRRFMGNLDFASAKFIVAGETIQLDSISLGISTSF
ncbi:MAG: hypothetical protein H7301_07105 [Cryobacterium sp.]|nr:hypothetical protein [Oligoflexia bacterium]